jgi:hypothetical protein
MNTKQLKHLFDASDLIWTGDKFAFKPAKNSEFFCINSLKSLESRTNENVAEAKNFLMEFDEGSLEDQTAAILKLESAGLNVASAVFSGSKSVHLILSMAESLNYDYRQTWIALAAEVRSLTGLNPDAACKNEARLSRLAGAVRADTGLEQSLLHTGGFITNAKIAELIAKHKVNVSIKKGVRTPINPDLDITDFENIIRTKKGIHSKIMNVHKWAQPVGMYNELFKLTKWIMDETGAPKEIVLTYASQKLFPTLLQAGYPEFKLDKAIHAAYDV